MDFNPNGELTEPWWLAVTEKSSFKQGVILQVAEALNCQAFLVAHAYHLEKFWVLDLRNPGKGRMEYDKAGYEEFIKNL